MSLPSTYKVLYGAIKPGQKYFTKEVPIPNLDKNQVLVKMQFAPLNPSDIMVLKGENKYADLTPHPAGLEGSGVIAAVGPDLKQQHKIGDKVHVYAYGTYGEYVVAESDFVYPIRGDLSMEEAASHFINPGTVYYMGLLAQGHKAAIHTAGASALGRILIRYFKHLGIKLINIVRKDEYIGELKAEGADYVLNSNAPDFETQLKEIAYRENATFGLDAINGDFPNIIIRNMPPKSILYVYGALSGSHYTNIKVWDLLQGRSLSSLLVVGYVEELRETGGLKEFFEETHKLLPTYFRSKVEKVYKVGEIDEALEDYSKNSSKGKILFTPN